MRSDKATLFTVYSQFAALLKHTAERGDVASTRAVLARWQRRLNVPATIAVAILSFAALPPSLDAQGKAARDFIRDFGAQYMTHYKVCGVKTLQDVRDELTMQLAQFNAREGMFASLDEDKSAIARQAGEFNPRLVWSLYAESTLARVALVLLSVSASEAAVERSFSAQAFVHSKERNRLHSETIEAEMFLKFNYRAMQSREQQPQSPGVIEMDEDFDADDDDAPHIDCFAVPVVDEAASTDDEMEEEEDGDIEMEEAPLPDSASVRRRARRELSIVHPSLDHFVAWFIAEHRKTPATTWNADLRNALLRYSSRIPAPVPTFKSIEESIRSAVVVAPVQ